MSKLINGTVVCFKAPNVKVKYLMHWIDKKYKKALKRSVFVSAHSEYDLKEGDNVLIKSCAPISKTKRYIVIKEDI